VPNSGKVLNVRVALDALESRFQGQDSGPLQGVLNYLFTQSLTASRVLELKDLNVTDNRTRRGKRPGQALVNARFDFHPRNAPGWPRWEADVRLKPAFPVALLFGWTGSKVKISRSTLMEGEAKLSGQTFQPGAIEARGRMILSGLSSTELPILSALIQQTRLKGLNDTFSGDQPFQFKVRNGRAEFRELYLTQGYVRLNGQGEYTFAQPGGPLLQQGNLDALFRIEAVGTVLRQVPLVGRIPFVSRLISQGDQVISQLVLQFRVTGDPGNPTVEPQVGSGLLNPLGTVDQAVTGVTREIRRGGEQAPGFFARIIRWIIDRISPPIVHQWRREGLQVLPQPGTPGTVMIPGFVSPLRSPAVSAEPNRLR
jgi:hypothetical protein